MTLETPDAPMRIMSFNLQAWRPYDSKGLWLSRKRSVQAQIHHNDPDVLAVQEARWPQRLFLKRRLRGFKAWGRPRGNWFSEACNVLTGPSVFAQNCSTIWLSSHPTKARSRPNSARRPRVATLLELAPNATSTRDNQGQMLQLANTHLDETSPELRAFAISVLIDHLDLTAPAVIVGDFNCKANATELALLTKSGFRPALDQQSGCTYRKHAPQAGPIDNFFTNFDAVESDWRLTSAWVSTHPQWSRASDHWPIIAELRHLRAGANSSRRLKSEP